VGTYQSRGISVTNAVLAEAGQKYQALGRGAAGSVVAAVRNASQRTGADFSYLLEKASVESGYDTNAKAAGSSATGLFQFIDSTWLNMVEEHGSKYGLGQFADAIEHKSDGTPFIRDPNVRLQVLNLRKDPQLSALMAGELAQDNKEALQDELGRSVGKTDLYMAHFLGAGGAAKFLKALAANPNQRADTLLPEAARANRGVFYGDSGRALSVGEIYNRFASKFDGEDGTRFARASSFGTIQAEDTTSQPWLSSRSGASGKEPLSTFTVMLLDQMMTPLDDPNQQDDKNKTGRTAPGLGAVIGI
jgi:hypothetical protein